jgi:LysR family transcriptional activator of nhaA
MTSPRWQETDLATLNYHHLRYFWAIASEGGLTRAAQRLNVSPSSLSVQLKALEDQLGQHLFERRGRTLQLTEAGRIALDYANSVFRSGDELLNTLKGLGSQERQVLRIGAVATLSRNFQLGLLKPLIHRPDVELVVRSGAFGDLLAQLEGHALDLVLANQPATVDLDSDWVNTLIADQPVSLVGHPEDDDRPFEFPGDLAHVPIVLPGRGSAVRTAFDALLDAARVTPVILAEVDDMAMLRLIARESHGVTLVPPVVVLDELSSGLLVERRRLPEIRESFYAITRRRRFPNPLLRELAAGLPAEAALPLS